jgi:imidazole glycerol-phosphate synthase subunit HisH
MITIIDYGMGNLFSVQTAIEYLGEETTTSSDPSVICKAKKLILPGVGSFLKAMQNIKTNNLFRAIKESVDNKTPILGICLGQQLLSASSTEDNFCEGLGFIESPIERFSEKTINSNLKVPHVGFNTVTTDSKSRLFYGLDSNVDFYFTHSYRMAYSNQSFATGLCSHGDKFVAAFEKDHICGTQFHPEKSQTNGLIVLKNFIEKF